MRTVIRKCRFGLCLFCFVSVMFATVVSAEERSVAGRKIISFGWDMPYAEVFARKVREIEATGLDGIAINFSGGQYTDARGREQERDMRFWWVHSRPVQIKNIQHGIDALKGVDFGRLQHNFLTMYTSGMNSLASPEQFFIWDSEKYDTSRYRPFWPGKAGTNQSWPKDPYQYFNAFKQNMLLAAKICKELGLVGFLLDQETYTDNGMGPMHHPWVMEVFDEDLETIQARMRKNVAEVFRAVCEEYPEIVILLIPGGRYGSFKYTYEEHNDGLVKAFSDGVLLGLGPKASVYDGGEGSYDMTLHKRFANFKTVTREMGLMYSDVPEIYRKRMKYSFGVWMDYRSSIYGGWPSNQSHFTARDFETALHNALYESDGYVWIYSEAAIMWSAKWRKVKNPNVQPNVPQAYLDAIRNCKTPRPLDRRRDPRGADKEPLPAPAASYKTKGDSFETAAPGMELIAEIKDGWGIHFDSEDIGLWSGGFRYNPKEWPRIDEWWRTRRDKIEWQPIEVGEFWERQGHRYNGKAWYRVQFKVPENYRGRKIYIVLGGLSDQFNVYLNIWDDIRSGHTSVGGDPITIQPNAIKYGDEENSLTVQINNNSGPGGIYKPVWLAVEKGT